MKLIALLIALVVERLVTHLLHLRELRWFDAYFDAALARMRDLGAASALLAAVVTLLLPVIPVLAVSILFQDVLWDVPYLAFAVFVLLFSLGPRDLGTEVEEYCAAAAGDDQEALGRVRGELMETGSTVPLTCPDLEVEEAIFIQSKNRLFGVLFWFIVFGPTGAWMFRVSDLFRRRTVFEARRLGYETPPGNLDTVQVLNGLLAWIPARLVSLGFALAGSFEEAIRVWRSHLAPAGQRFFDSSAELVARVGRGALARAPADRSDLVACSDGASSAMRLVVRTLFVWVTVIAVMTIIGWAY